MSLSMSTENHKGERIAKKIARAGLCSRRDAEKWIEDGRVSVNGKTLTSAACVVGEDDVVVVDGKPLKEKSPTRLFLYHKPAGLVTSHKDEKGRSTIFDQLPEYLPRVVSVGRLDLNTEGLLLLTNDGELSRYLELPATGWKRKYRVRVHGRVDSKKLDILKKGITVEGIHYKSIEAEIDEGAAEKSGTNTWLNVTLREGKNREIRRVMEAIGLSVNRLIRISYGPFQLGMMPVQTVQEVTKKVMKDQIKGYFGGKEEPLAGENEEAKPAARKTRAFKAMPRKPATGKGQPKPSGQRKDGVSGEKGGYKGEGKGSQNAQPKKSAYQDDRSYSAKPNSAKPKTAKTEGAHSRSSKPYSGKPHGGKSAGAKPAGGKPRGKRS